MASFGELQIEVLPLTEGAEKSGRVSVGQIVRTANGENRVAYSMQRTKTGEWKLVNVVLNGVNLGKTFKNQFMQAMKKQGDLDAVIAEWGAETSEIAAH